MKKLYIAGPLFSKAELDFNNKIKNILLPYFSIFLPQEDGELLVENEKTGEESRIARKRIFLQDIEALKECDCVLMLLDGRTIDEGACFELGYAYANKKVCVGFQSDPRRLLNSGNNPMIDEALEKTFTSIEQLVSWARIYSPNILELQKISKL